MWVSLLAATFGMLKWVGKGVSSLFSWIETRKGVRQGRTEQKLEDTTDAREAEQKMAEKMVEHREPGETRDKLSDGSF